MSGSNVKVVVRVTKKACPVRTAPLDLRTPSGSQLPF
jgi:hypothetical protein